MDYNLDYQIFVSYRREGGESLAALLYERLTRMGYRVFYDVESLRSGDFNEKLLGVIEKCEDVLVVLPPNGLDRCIDNPEDWVRREIEHAMQCGKNIIPVLMRNFVFPDNLPESMAMLPRYNGVSANMDYFDAVLKKMADHMLQSKVEYPSDRDYVEEVERKSAEGSQAATNELALIYEHGMYSEPQNLEKAFSLYQKAFEGGYLHAGYNLGDIFERCAKDLTLISEYGLDTEGRKEPEEIRQFFLAKAKEYYEMTATAKLAPAQYRLGNLQEKDGDYEAAIQEYKKAAEMNYLPALNALGWIYHNGFGGIEADREKAKYYYKRAKDKEYPAAIYNYAMLIRSEQDKEEEAVKLLRQVAYGEDAIPLATYALGWIYEEKKELRNAIVCYEQAFAHGVREAGVSLERCRNTIWDLEDKANAGD